MILCSPTEKQTNRAEARYDCRIIWKLTLGLQRIMVSSWSLSGLWLPWKAYKTPRIFIENSKGFLSKAYKIQREGYASRFIASYPKLCVPSLALTKAFLVRIFFSSSQSKYRPSLVLFSHFPFNPPPLLCSLFSAGCKSCTLQVKLPHKPPAIVPGEGYTTYGCTGVCRLIFRKLLSSNCQNSPSYPLLWWILAEFYPF